MEATLVAKSAIDVNAPASKVWSVLINPISLQQVMLGMQPKSDWKEGSELRWIGRHEEKPNDNAKGIIQVMTPNKTLQFTFYYPGYGYADEAKNYNTVVFNLSPKGDATTVDVAQGDFSVFKEGETFRMHSQTFWKAALSKLKEVVEESQKLQIP